MAVPGCLQRVTVQHKRLARVRVVEQGAAENAHFVCDKASAKLARSETCSGCVPTGGSRANLKPTFSWNKKQGWKVELMP